MSGDECGGTCGLTTGDRWSKEAAVVGVKRGDEEVAAAAEAETEAEAEEAGPAALPENAEGAAGCTERPAMMAASRALSTAWVAASLTGESPVYEGDI